MRIVFILVIVLFSSCYSEVLDLKEEETELPTGSTVTLGVQTIYNYGEMASIVYEDEVEIARFFANKGYDIVYTSVLSNSQVRYIYLRDDFDKHQLVIIRGTDNQENAYTDVNAVPYYEANVGWLHKGFRNASDELFLELEKTVDLKDNFRTTIIGHSLGGAMSSILGILMLEAGYSVNWVFTYGQPKFTDEEGAEKYSTLPLIRIVGAGDTVAAVPPDVSEIKYVHIGLKVSLDDSSLTHVKVGHSSNRDNDTSPTDLSEVLNHRMTVYLSRLSSHLDETLTIEFEDQFSWKSRL